MESTPPNQRQFSRIAFHVPAVLHMGELQLPVQLLDIALKGALVQTNFNANLHFNAPCRLILTLADGGSTIAIEGRIAHLQKNTDGQHVGIQCTHIDVTSLTELRRLLELNTGDADLMDRELTQLIVRP